MDQTHRSRRDVLIAGATGIAGAIMTKPSTGLAAETRSQSQSPKTQSAPHRYRVSVAGYSFRQFLDSPGKPGKMSLRDVVDLAAEIGIAAIEPTSYYFLSEDDEFVYGLKRHAFLRGIDISGTPVRNNFCLPAGPELDKNIAHIRKWVDICVKLGSPAIRIFAGKPHKEISREQILPTVISAMKEATLYAGSKGIFLGIENHGYMTETADDVLRLVDGVANDWLGINLDTGNFHGDAYANIAKAAPRAITCQIKTLVRKQNSDEREPADFARIVRILREAGYRGYLTLEYEGSDPNTEVPAYLRQIQQAACA